MPFDIDNLGAGIWFTVPNDANPPERVKIRFPDAGFQKAIDNDTIETIVEYVPKRKKSGKIDRRYPPDRIEFQRIIKGKEAEREERYLDGIIEDWDIRKPDGTQIECSKENKSKMMAGSVEFNGFVNDAVEFLGPETEKAETDQKKTLLNGASGQPPEQLVKNAA